MGNCNNKRPANVEVPQSGRVSITTEPNLKLQYDTIKKVLLLGESGVGKTALCLRYTDRQFNESHIATIGVDFKVKDLMRNDQRVRLQIWDTAGQERYRTITSTYYRGVNGVLIVYDMSDKASFSAISRWMEEITANAGDDIIKMVIGNKSDLTKVVDTNTAKSFADTHGALFMECSAKTGENVDEAFELLVDHLIKQK